MADITKTIDQLKAVVTKDIHLGPNLNIVKTVKEKAASVTVSKTKKVSSSSHLRNVSAEDKLEPVPLVWAIMSYISYIFLVVTGYLRELIWGIGPIDTPFGREFNREGYAPLEWDPGRYWMNFQRTLFLEPEAASDLVPTAR